MIFHTRQMHNELRRESHQLGHFRRLVFRICKSKSRPYCALDDLAHAGSGVLQLEH